MCDNMCYGLESISSLEEETVLCGKLLHLKTIESLEGCIKPIKLVSMLHTAAAEQFYVGKALITQEHNHFQACISNTGSQVFV